MSIHKIISSMLAIALCAAIGLAQEDENEAKINESFRAFGVSMTAGVSGALEFHITRWTTPEERKMLIQSLVENGQEKTVELLRKQEETGWSRTQSGAGMRGWPSVRLHYAYQFPQEDGSRIVVLVTDRNITMAEARGGGRSLDYEVSGVIMQLAKNEKGEEEGSGTLFAAAKLGFDKEKQQIEIESLGSQPIKLSSIKRTK